MTEEIKNLNNILKSRYGLTESGQPLFRVVWSSEQLEVRIGRFAEYYGKLFLREVTGARQVPKYPWVKDRWILERWLPGSLTATPEIPDTYSGSYEPVQVFEHADGNPVPVTERIITEIIWNLFNIQLPGHSSSEHKSREAIEFDKEVELNRLHLEEVGSALIKDGESII